MNETKNVLGEMRSGRVPWTTMLNITDRKIPISSEMYNGAWWFYRKLKEKIERQINAVYDMGINTDTAQAISLISKHIFEKGNEVLDYMEKQQEEDESDPKTNQ